MMYRFEDYNTEVQLCDHSSSFRFEAFGFEVLGSANGMAAFFFRNRYKPFTVLSPSNMICRSNYPRISNAALALNIAFEVEWSLKNFFYILEWGNYG